MIMLFSFSGTFKFDVAPGQPVTPCSFGKGANNIFQGQLDLNPVAP